MLPVKPSNSSVSRRTALFSWTKAATAAAAAGLFTCVATEKASAGYGTCSRCACAGFQADYRNNNVCSNCGHNYTDHW